MGIYTKERQIKDLKTLLRGYKSHCRKLEKHIDGQEEFTKELNEEISLLRVEKELQKMGEKE